VVQDKIQARRSATTKKTPLFKMQQFQTNKVYFSKTALPINKPLLLNPMLNLARHKRRKQ